MSHPSRNNYGQCAVCFAEKDEEIVKCVKCNLTVHGQCYGSSFRDSNKPHDGWKCRYCHANGSYKHFKCRICNSSKFGALKACEKGSQYKFAHLVCAKWTSFICIGGEYNQAPIKGIERCDKLKSALNKLHCDICKQNHATMKCRVKGCNKFYHPLCLIETNRKCMIESNGKKIDNMATTIYYTYCPDHVQLHQEWDSFGSRKKKNREVILNTNTRCIDNVISQNNDPNDIRMSGSDKKDDDNDDADSDIVILSNKKNTNSDTNGGLDKLENTKQARQKKHRIECVPNVTKITIISERNDESQNNLINPEINDETSNDGTLISANRAVASDGGPLQLNSAFFKDYTPAPSVPSIGSFGLPSSWNDRLNNNPFMDTMSIMGGFDDGNFPFGNRECSPLMNIDNTMPLINDDIEINDKRDGDDRGLADDQGGLNENRVNMEVQISQTHQTPQPQHQPVHEQPPHEQIMHGQMMDETDFSKISHGYNTETGTNSNNYYDHPQHIHNGMNPGFPHYYYPMPYYAYDQQNIPLYYVNPNYHNHNHQNYMQIAHHSQQQQQEQTCKESMNIDGPQLFNERSSTDSTFATISPKQGTGSNLTTPTNTINFQDECSKNNKSQFTYTNPEL